MSEESTTTADSPPAKKPTGRRLMRVAVVLAFIVIASGGIYELWAYRAFRGTISELQELENSSNDDIALDDALALPKGWYTVESEESTFREDVTIRWNSLFGEYWIRINATKKSNKQPKQFFTGFSTSTTPPPTYTPPTDKLPVPDPPVLGSGPGSRKAFSKKKRNQKSRPKMERGEKTEAKSKTGDEKKAVKSGSKTEKPAEKTEAKTVEKKTAG